MILLDTHIWRWWVSGDANLARWQHERIEAERASGIRVSAISCWEMAKAVETGNLKLSLPVEEWLDAAPGDPDVRLVPLSPRVAVESCRLPTPMHKDPGDQIIVATARVENLELMTSDGLLLRYPHVQLARP
jgi:PIN domain nuclease of toxin-antitoxin system